MHVSRTIREYIEREVETRLERKYTPLRLESERRTAAIEAMNKGIKSAGLKAAKEYVKEHIHEVKDFAEDNSDNIRSILPNFILKHSVWSDDVQRWQDNLRREKDAKVNEISALLELGGDKEDLERFLRELDGQEAA